jgi:hypothetical protein
MNRWRRVIATHETTAGAEYFLKWKSKHLVQALNVHDV